MPADKAGKTSKKEQKKSKKTAATTPKSKKGESSTKILPASEKEDNIGVEIQEHPRVVEDPENDVQISSDDESEEDDVDEEGMEKLMAALGEDGLDEFAQAELRMLAGESDEEDDSDQGSDDDEGEEDEGDVSEAEEEGDSDENEEDDEVIPLDEAESVDEDIVPTQKVEIDNEIALERIRETIRLDPSMPWTETLTVTFPESIDVDVDDDLNRELAFYKQALHGAAEAKSLAAKHGLPFTRPSDYFAEMVKSDAHMERIRQRLLDESATIKRSEEKRREREGKKFGKQIQQEKLKERERSKKDMEERLKGLKRKRKGALDAAQDGDDDAFDVAVEDAISDRPSKRGRSSGSKRGLSRQARDNKFGFGSNPGRRAKQNTKSSTDDFGSHRGGARGRGGFRGARGGRGGFTTKRPGKSRRADARSR